MPIEIMMPALSPTMEEGTLAKWLVKEGDQVTSGDIIAEIETDKATMEVESIDEGTIGKILVAEGSEGVKVNAIIAILLEEGEDASAVNDNLQAVTISSVEAPLSVAPAASSDEAVQDSAKTISPAISVPQIGAQSSNQMADNRFMSSPLARRIAQNANIELVGIAGTGPHGRIVKRDVEAVIATGRGKTNQSSAASTDKMVTALAASPSADMIMKLYAPDSYEVIPHDTMRKTIAKRLVQAKQTIPHFYLTVECELDALLDLRKQLNDAAPQMEEGRPAYKVSINDMIIKAHAMALKAVPDANASWTDAGMLRHKYADIGVAVAIPGGLITPIIRHACEKSLSVISNEMKDLAKRARERKLMPEEYQGGSSAVSNLGMFGIKEFAAVINPPHSTILAVGAGIKQPIVKNNEIVIGTLMSATLSTDHRAVDGALGAELLQSFRNYIKNPVTMLI